MQRFGDAEMHQTGEEKKTRERNNFLFAAQNLYNIFFHLGKWINLGKISLGLCALIYRNFIILYEENLEKIFLCISPSKTRWFHHEKN